MPLANPGCVPLCQLSGPARAANAERRVRARGTSASQAAARWKLSAVPISRWFSSVFARPMYLVRRRPQRWTPCEMVPSMPARSILRRERRRVLPLPGGLQRLVVLAPPDPQHPLAPAGDALRPGRAGAAVRQAEADEGD